MADIIKTEFFSIDKSKIKNLFVYKIESTSNNVRQLGGKLKYKLNKIYSNNIFGWNKEKGFLVSDLNIPDIHNLLERLWKDDEKYRLLKNIIQVNSNIDNVSIAEYVISYNSKKYNRELLNLKNKYKEAHSSDNFCVNLEINFRAWEINNEPCISIGINHKIIYGPDLSYYYDKENKEIVNMQVVVVTRFSSYNSTGTIVKVYGRLEDEADRLSISTKNEWMKRLIEGRRKTNPDEPIVQVKFSTSDNTYDYVMGALRPVIRIDTVFKDDKLKGIYSQFKIKPDTRYKLIIDIYDIIKESGFFNGNIDNNYNNSIFNILEKNYWQPLIKVGNNKTVPYQTYFIGLLNNYGLYLKNKKFDNNKLKILIINESGKNIDDYIQWIETEFKALKFDIDIEILNKTFDTFSESINNYPSDILLFIGGYNFNDYLYFRYKSRLLSNDMQSQFLTVDNIKNKYSVANIVLGILGKTGNIPFILDNEKYADCIVGIDISRERKKNNSGTINVAAMTRIYSYDGNMIKYKIVSGEIEGETIPEQTLYKIYMDDELKNKEVIFHRDGPFRGNEINILNKIANKLNSKFYFIEINKRNTPRLYKYNNGVIDNPDIGTCLNIGNNEYIIITSASKIGTLQPLRVKFYNIDFEKGMKSIYNLIIMDYGSLKPPKIPVTTYYSDKISYYALRGVLPKNAEGSIPFWL